MKKITFSVPVYFKPETVGDILDLYGDNKENISSYVLENLSQDQMAALEQAFFEECTQGHGIIASGDDLKEAVSDLDFSDYATVHLDEYLEQIKKANINEAWKLDFDCEVTFDVEAMVQEKEGSLSAPEYEPE